MNNEREKILQEAGLSTIKNSSFVVYSKADFSDTSETSDSDTEFGFSSSGTSWGEDSTFSDDDIKETPKPRRKLDLKLVDKVDKLQEIFEQVGTSEIHEQINEGPINSSNEIEFVDEIHQLLLEYINHIPHNFSNKLLSILLHYTSAPFPRDIRTLLKTPRKIDSEKMADGEYCHYGLKKKIDEFLEKYIKNFPEKDSIKLFAFVDGFPTSKSSDKSAWVISISETLFNQVSTVGGYYGETKPPANIFLRKFVNELKEVIAEGVKKGKIVYQVILKGLTCDVPAKSFVLGIKGHNGYNACLNCDIHGQSLKRTVYFRGIGKNKRTDAKFKRNEYLGSLQLNNTIMNEIPNFNCISDTPQDYMHSVCLGIMKKLLQRWLKGPRNVRLTKKQRKTVCSKLIELHGSLPKEFSNRKPKKLKHLLSGWKATDYRQFLLYTGPVVLKDILRKDLYEHFLLLHWAISILTNETYCRETSYLDIAEKLLTDFNKISYDHYGLSFMSMNTHNLLHLVKDVRKFGKLDNFSAFKFENHLGKLGKLFRKAEKPLQQLGRRFGELEHLKVDHLLLEKSSFDRPYQGVETIYRRVFVDFFERYSNSFCTIDTQNDNDNCLILNDGSIIRCNCFARTAENEFYVLGKKFTTSTTLYNKSWGSVKLSVPIVEKNISNELNKYHVEDIAAKACVLPSKTELIMFPIIHTFLQFTFKNATFNV